jgi:hypothetical protein
MKKFFVVCFLFPLLQAREAAKSGLVLFHEAMETFENEAFLMSFARLKKAAAKGHQEAIWILSVQEGATDQEGWKQAFAQTNTPLGWYCAGVLAQYNSIERVEFWKKSAEGGCSWGMNYYAWCFGLYGNRDMTPLDEELHLYWLTKAVELENPSALVAMGELLQSQEREEEALTYFRASVERGWNRAIQYLFVLFWRGSNPREGALWAARQAPYFIGVVKNVQDSRKLVNLNPDIDFNELCYSIGWGMYWYQYGDDFWDMQMDSRKAFGDQCLDYYCENANLQQESIFTFLMWWNRTTGGVKGPGQMIAHMVWEGRRDCLITPFER